MAGLRDTIQNITTWLKDLFEFGIAVILLLVLIEIVFPDFPGVIDNIGEIVGKFAENGIIGLIALLVFLLIYKK